MQRTTQSPNKIVTINPRAIKTDDKVFLVALRKAYYKKKGNIQIFSKSLTKDHKLKDYKVELDGIKYSIQLEHKLFCRKGLNEDTNEVQHYYGSRMLSVGEGNFGAVHTFVEYNENPDEILTPTAEQLVVKKISLNNASYDSVQNEIDCSSDMEYLNMRGSIFSANKCYIIMNHLEGKNLSQWMKEEHITKDEFYSISISLIENLKMIHEKNITHADIKPHNVIVTSSGSGRVKGRIIDFGLSLRSDSNKPYVCRGTPKYFAPEIFAYEEWESDIGKPLIIPDNRVDIYSLGVTLGILYKKLRDQLSVLEGPLIENLLEEMSHYDRDKRMSLDKALKKMVLISTGHGYDALVKDLNDYINMRHREALDTANHFDKNHYRFKFLMFKGHPAGVKIDTGNKLVMLFSGDETVRFTKEEFNAAHNRRLKNILLKYGIKLPDEFIQSKSDELAEQPPRRYCFTS